MERSPYRHRYLDAQAMKSEAPEVNLSRSLVLQSMEHLALLGHQSIDFRSTLLASLPRKMLAVNT